MNAALEGPEDTIQVRLLGGTYSVLLTGLYKQWQMSLEVEHSETCTQKEGNAATEASLIAGFEDERRSTSNAKNASLEKGNCQQINSSQQLPTKTYCCQLLAVRPLNSLRPWTARRVRVACGVNPLHL